MQISISRFSTPFLTLQAGVREPVVEATVNILGNTQVNLLPLLPDVFRETYAMGISTTRRNLI